MTNDIRRARPSRDEYFILLAYMTAKRATCRHRAQGSVLVRGDRIISTGYNGAPPGMEHCLDRGYCMKAQGLPCAAEGLHGESNAIISAARMGIAIEGSIIYSIYSPCLTCCNMIASAGIVRVVYAELYENYQEGPATLKKLGVEVEHISL